MRNGPGYAAGCALNSAAGGQMLVRNSFLALDGTGLERVTFNETFDGFPMFSPDGKKLVFASNRNAAKEGDTNVFVADWVE